MSAKTDQQQQSSSSNALEKMSTGDKELDSLLELYLEYEKRDEHKQHIEGLLKERDMGMLQKLIKNRLNFGTAGIRGAMGPGYSQMNDLVIIQTSQGLVSYLLEYDREICLKSGVIIGNDARHNSSRFARLAALAFLQKDIPVYFCDYIVPTPMVAFGLKYFRNIAGIVVTASHNPKTDNGYKVYWFNGAQILAPHDKEIQRHILKPENQRPWSLAWQEELLKLNHSPTTPSNQSSSSPSTPPQIPKEWSQKFFRVYKDLSMNYFDYIESLCNETSRGINSNSNICITYTTMHGVGHNFLSRALEIVGFTDTFPVDLQKKPDPEFPTVKFPNPEEAGALDLAFETAKHANSNLILAVDPDADRCAAALYDPKTGNKRVLNGNEIGSLLGWWLWHCHSNDYLKRTPDAMLKEAPEGEDEEAKQQRLQAAVDAATASGVDNSIKAEPADCYMISTAVSSKFLDSMAKIEGFKFIETLTGFKYMGNIADKLIQEQGKRVLFAYEEAIGYMVDSRILDKDGISAAIQLAQCAAYINEAYDKRTLEQQIDWLHAMYGYHYNLNSYYICTDSQKIKEIFHNIQSNYPKQFGRKFKVTRIRDLNNDYDSGTEDKKCTLPTSSSSFMVTFFINENITMTMRTSGTEPKIKYYSEIIRKLPLLGQSIDNLDSDDIHILYGAEQNEAKKGARNELTELVQLVIDQCLKPSFYNLEPASA